MLTFLAESTFILYVSCKSQMDTNSDDDLLDVALARAPECGRKHAALLVHFEELHTIGNGTIVLGTSMQWANEFLLFLGA